MRFLDVFGNPHTAYVHVGVKAIRVRWPVSAKVMIQDFVIALLDTIDDVSSEKDDVCQDGSSVDCHETT